METAETTKQTGGTDDVTKAIGEFGRWHVLLLILFAVSAKLTAVLTQLGIIFLAPKTTFVCIERSSSGDVVNSTCYDDCVAYKYTSEFLNTIISEWDLICASAWLSNFSQMVVMFGILVGSIFFGFLADRFGRRTGLLTAGTLQMASNLAIPFCSNFWVFSTVRFLLGTATAGTMVISFVILIEITGPKYREFMNCLYGMAIPIGQMLLPTIAYYFREWNTFSMGVAVPTMLCLVYFFVVPESPKWLISVGRLDEASEVMSSAAKCNKLPNEHMLEVVKRISNIDSVEKTRATYLDLVTVASLRLKNCCSCTIWLLLGFTYYGVNQYIGQTSSNVFLSVGMAGALQVPGILISGYLCHSIGRRNTVISLLVISGICNGLLAVPDEWFYVKLAVGSVGVSCASGAFTSMYMYTTELFPTVARNMAMGASSTTSRIGSMVAPFIAGLSAVQVWLPPAVFSAASLLAVAICCCLPETKGQKLADLIEK